MIIAVDGPSASGKSTVALAVALALGVPYLDTGSMYRAVTWVVLERGADPADERACGAIASSLDLSIVGPGRVAVDGRDVSEEIRGPLVTAAVSAVSAHQSVRRILVAMQRSYAEPRGAVVEGRDIGTVVFPDADLKVFLDAKPHERARRRDAQAGRAAGGDLARRDLADTAREASPLARAKGAVVIDTTAHSAEEVVAHVLELVANRDS